MKNARLSVQKAPFDPGAKLTRFTARAARLGAGGVVSFVGLVRDQNATLSALEIEHYPAMTEKAIHAIIDKAAQRWELCAIEVIHRYGYLAAHEPIMMVSTAAAHRAAAFESADFLMDYLKSRAPFWKKEISSQGQASWVLAKPADDAALERW